MIVFILAYTSSNSQPILVGFTTLNTIDLYLPIGNASLNYAIQLNAEIRDTNGAVTSFKFSTVTVRFIFLCIYISLFKYFT